jgi:hypothetical protein
MADLRHWLSALQEPRVVAGRDHLRGSSSEAQSAAQCGRSEDHFQHVPTNVEEGPGDQKAKLPTPGPIRLLSIEVSTLPGTARSGLNKLGVSADRKLFPASDAEHGGIRPERLR